MTIQSRSALRRYGASAAAVLLATLLRHFLDPYLGAESVFGYYYCAVAFAAWYGGVGPATLATLAGYLLSIYLFVPPRYLLEPSDVSSLIASGTYLFASATIVLLSRASHRAYQDESLRATQLLNQELEAQARRLAEVDVRKNQFLATLGHELRNPLSGVLGGVQAMKMLGERDAEAEEMRAVVERQANHMARLIDDLLDVSRIARGKIRIRREKIDLVEVVRHAAESLRCRSEESGVGIALRLSGAPLWVDGDPTRLSQVIGNLLANALKFTDAGGRVEVRMEIEGSRGVVTVADTGVGMDPETLARVFEAFVQAEATLERSRGGLGLGLALARGIVELHGGRMAAHSEGHGRGSTFRVELPICGDQRPPADPRVERQEVRGSRRVLVIDDRRDAVAPVRKMLELLGQQVAVACDGKSGLAKARELQPDLVLCDIGLPDVDGYSLAKALRMEPQFRSTRLIAVTGYAEEEHRRRAAEAGFDAHLTKPVSKDDLERLLADFDRLAPGPERGEPTEREGT